MSKRGSILSGKDNIKDKNFLKLDASLIIFPEEVTFNGDISFNSQVDISNLYIYNKLNVTGDVSLNAQVDINNLYILNNLDISGNVVFDSSDIKFINIDDTSNNSSVSYSNLRFLRYDTTNKRMYYSEFDQSLLDGLAFGQNTVLNALRNNNINFDQDVSFNSNVAFNSNVGFNSNVTFNEDISLNAETDISNLHVINNTIIDNNLTVNGNTTINSILHGIDISLSGTLSATTIAGNGISLSSNTARTSPDTRSIVNDIVNNSNFISLGYSAKGNVLRGNANERFGSGITHNEPQDWPCLNSRNIAMNASGTVKAIGVPLARYDASIGGNPAPLDADGRVIPVDVSDCGQVRVFQYNNITNQWEPKGNIIKRQTADSQLKNLRFGYSLDLNNDGDIIVIGEPGADSSLNSVAGHGAVYVYYYNNVTNNWDQLNTTDNINLSKDRLVSNLTIDRQMFGYSVAINGNAKVKRDSSNNIIGIQGINNGESCRIIVGAPELSGDMAGGSDFLGEALYGNLPGANIDQQPAQKEGFINIYEYFDDPSQNIEFAGDISGGGFKLMYYYPDSSENFLGPELGISGYNGFIATDLSHGSMRRTFSPGAKKSDTDSEKKQAVGWSVAISDDGKTVATGAPHFSYINDSNKIELNHGKVYILREVTYNSYSLPVNTDTSINYQNLVYWELDTYDDTNYQIYGGNKGEIIDNYVDPDAPREFSYNFLNLTTIRNAKVKATYTGVSIALSGDGNTIAIGSPGAKLGVTITNTNRPSEDKLGGTGYVRVYKKDISGWCLITPQDSSGVPIAPFIGNYVDSQSGTIPSRFGLGLDINYDGTIICIGAPMDSTDLLGGPPSSSGSTADRHGSISILWYGKANSDTNEKWHLMQYTTGTNLVATRDFREGLFLASYEPAGGAKNYETGSGVALNKDGTFITFSSGGADFSPPYYQLGYERSGHVDTFCYKTELTTEAQYKLYRIINTFNT